MTARTRAHQLTAVETAVPTAAEYLPALHLPPDWTHVPLDQPPTAECLA